MRESGHKHENMQMSEIIWNVITAIKNLNREMQKKETGREESLFTKKRPFVEVAFELKSEYKRKMVMQTLQTVASTAGSGNKYKGLGVGTSVTCFKE